MTFDGTAKYVPLSDGSPAWDDGTGRARTKYGWDALEQLGKRLCALVGTFRTLILRSFGDNPIVVALIEVIDLLCPMLDDCAGGFARGDNLTGSTISKSEIVSRLRSIADKLESAV